MFASFQNVLFVFDNGTDNDLSVYEYELYEEDDILNPNIFPYTLKLGATALSTGAGNSSVFAVPVQGSYIDIGNNNIVVQKNFFGRVRAKDTSGNVGSWTDIKKTDPSTPLIDSQYIVSLTADKIKAGEIEAAEIVLGGANPSQTLIKSANYSATLGWQIDGAGNATFNSATIRGQFSSGTSPNWFRVDTSGNIWSGGSTYNNALFKVSNTGALTSTSGSIGGWTISSTTLTGGNASLSNTGILTLGSSNDVAVLSAQDATFRLWIGNSNPASATFKVTKAGSVTATTGRLGPFNISTTSFSSNSDSGYSLSNFFQLVDYGDVFIYSNPSVAPHSGLYHKTSIVGEYITIRRTDSSWQAVVGTHDSFINLGYPGSADAPELVIQGTNVAGFSRLEPNGLTVGKTSSTSYYEHNRTYVNGNIIATGTKNFQIVHPIYEDKYLVHAACESNNPDIYYRGISELVNGEVEIELPEYFELISEKHSRTVTVTPFSENKYNDVSYLHVSKVENNKFKVWKTENSNNQTQKFYWRVDAIRSNVEFSEIKEMQY